MEIRFCYRHPETLAHFRCFQCKRFICSECRQTLAHHYFCSRKCFYQYLIGQGMSKISSYRRYALLAWNIGLTVVLLVIGFRLEKLSEPKAGPGRETSRPVAPVGPPALQDAAARRTKAPPTLSVSRDRYLLRLQVPAHALINVWRNGQPLFSKISNGAGLLDLHLKLVPGPNRFELVVFDSAYHVVTGKHLVLLYRKPVPAVPVRSIDRVAAKSKKLALTFDGGGNGNVAEQILAILRARGIHATMFLTGRFIERYPHLVKEMVADGHEVANHTYSHPHLTTFAQNKRQDLRPGVTREFLQDQLQKTDSLFYQLTGRHLARYWRAPYGEFNDTILRWAAELGYQHIHWTPGLDTFDWVSDKNSPLYRTPVQIRKAILSRDGDGGGLRGAIVLMHLGSDRAGDSLVQALPELIDELLQRGYHPVTVTHLLR
ncbi:MAG: hypothetical protein D6715_04490 [Calditrichaeota bacterium]|nr:MAG: hypothetical protein D6715_04490 [Calditrichota bacterium]